MAETVRYVVSKQGNRNLVLSDPGYTVWDTELEAETHSEFRTRESNQPHFIHQVRVSTVSSVRLVPHRTRHTD